jgi:hypothetical protein
MFLLKFRRSIRANGYPWRLGLKGAIAPGPEERIDQKPGISHEN